MKSSLILQLLVTNDVFKIEIPYGVKICIRKILALL